MMFSATATTIFALLGTSAAAETFMAETFTGSSSDVFGKWVQPTEWRDDLGEWKLTDGTIQTGQDARFFGLSAPLDKTFDNKNSDIVIQYTVKHGQSIDCGGGYIKLLPKIDQASFSGDAPYAIMFGPDICGGTKKTHVIFGYDKTHGSGDRKNVEMKRTVQCKSDTLTHLYTLIVKADGTYEVKIDGKSEQSGELKDDWDFLEPKQIPDPAESKPSDWVDEKMIPDPEDKKPEGWDDIPEEIPDPEASQPEDWDEEDDGEWEPPMIPNPEFKGEWKPKMIDNPDYKGEWEHPLIDNPDYEHDDQLHHVCSPCSHVGFELWQVKSGTQFDHIMVTDSVEEAEQEAEEILKAIAAEKEQHEKEEEEKRKKAEEEAKKAAEEADDDDDDDDDDDEDEDEIEDDEL
eukprot:g2285.t1